MKDEEHLLLKERAAKAGMSLSAYVKKKCFEDSVLVNLFKRQEE
jgi:hypothetical protein